ncbi:unannotated protein [freshwater metagenome]|jgi:uncharacterized protein YciI|uniref:Unannotated protein n=1 Tax=freshwater metagenome TaxID=449393 RepID=A0A6J6JDZ7_9ZZZZ|nr:hypothetical protein [Actinomycetota bacterium]MSZ23284.1 hypothetical protein [Actinomycetota bacterium]
MPTFAVRYFYSAAPEYLAELRPTHREWVAQQFADGVILASGPMVDTAGALLICMHESLLELSQVLDQDPFDLAGFIGERVIEQWNPVTGPWSEK